MKKLKATFLVAVMVAFGGLSSCKKDNSNNPSGNGKATVEAKNYGFDGASGTFKSTAAGIVQVGNIFTLTAVKDGTNESITIILNNVNGTGTFDLIAGNADGHGAIISKDYTKPADGTLNYSTDNAGATGMRGGGQVKITSLTSDSAEGTFYLVAHNSAGKEAFAENGAFKGSLIKR